MQRIVQLIALIAIEMREKCQGSIGDQIFSGWGSIAADNISSDRMNLARSEHFLSAREQTALSGIQPQELNLKNLTSRAQPQSTKNQDATKNSHKKGTHFGVPNSHIQLIIILDRRKLTPWQ